MAAMKTRDAAVLALCLWREARGCGNDARRGVLHVILNRMKAHDRSASDVILAPLQFSSFNAADPNYRKFPMPDDQAWIACCELVDNPGDDPTDCATNYESCPENHEPKWADDSKRTAVIGQFEFYKL
jgi:hypothetical protein